MKKATATKLMVMAGLVTASALVIDPQIQDVAEEIESEIGNALTSKNLFDIYGSPIDKLARTLHSKLKEQGSFLIAEEGTAVSIFTGKNLKQVAESLKFKDKYGDKYFGSLTRHVTKPIKKLSGKFLTIDQHLSPSFDNGSQTPSLILGVYNGAPCLALVVSNYGE